MKNRWFRNGTIATLALCYSVGAALADTTTTTSSALPIAASKSTAEATVGTKKSILIPDAISDWVIFTGPGVKDPESMGTPDDSIGSKQPLNMEHLVGFKYNLSDTVALVPTMDMNYNFTDPNNGGADRGFSWGDAYLSLRKSNLIVTSFGNNAFKASGFLNYYAPTSKPMRENNSPGSVAVWFNPSLQFGKSKWSLSAYSFARYYAETKANSVISGNPNIQSKFYVGPQLNYEFNQAVTGYFLWEGVVRTYTDGRPDWVRNGSRSLSDVEPGAMINVSKKVMLMPYLNWFLNQPIDTVSVNLNASLRLL